MSFGLRKHLTYTNAIVTLALVFAMTGGAYAAGKYVITSTKQISPKTLKELQGKTGSMGATGPAGGVGPTGPAGEKGSVGEKGPAGSNGTSGVNGESVLSATVGKGAHCLEGGSEFKVGGATPTYACNGVPGPVGPKGAAGSPWTAEGTLPAKATETGAWGGNIYQDENDLTISFPIPLAKALKASEVHIIGSDEGEGGLKVSPAITAGECKGALSSPGAAEGNLCVFVGQVGGNVPGEELSNIVDFFHIPPELGAGTVGAVLEIEAPEAKVGEKNYGDPTFGTWAVTG